MATTCFLEVLQGLLEGVIIMVAFSFAGFYVHGFKSGMWRGLEGLQLYELCRVCYTRVSEPLCRQV